MANGKTPYDEDYKSPYKNNTLRGMIGNAADYVGGVVSHDIDQMEREVQMQKEMDKQNLGILKDKGKDILEAEKDVFIDNPIKYATAATNFLAGTPEVNLPEGNRMPNANRQRLQRPTTESTGGTAGTTQPTQQGQSGTTTQGGTRGTGTTQTTQTTQTNVQTPNFSSKEDVVYYLASNTPGRNNLTEEQRVAMVENLWNQSSQGATTSGDQTSNSLPSDYSDTVTQNMESDLSNSSEGTLYGKVGGETGGVSSNQDATNVYDIAEQGRIAAVREILTESPSALAAAIYGGTNPYSDQTMRDVRKYAPEYWNTVQAELKKLQTGDNVNAIASGESIKTVADTTDVKNDTVTYAVNNSTQSVSSTNLLKSIDQKLAMNNDASTAESTMDLIAEEMERQKKRLSNLQKEANTVFKGDASQQLVNAYISNKSQEIHNELSILEGRYNAALDRYKLAVSHAERAADYELKKNSLQLDWYKELNKTGNTTTSSGVGSMRTERHNNPTAMTVGFMQWAGIEPDGLYEIGDPFTSTDANGVTHTYYTAKLLGDPLDTTIKILNQAIANGHNPFNTGSWSYMNQLGMNIEKWNSMTDDQKKSFIVNDWLPHEGGNITKMAYYAGGTSNTGGTSYDMAFSNLYDTFLSGKRPNESFLNNAAKATGQTVEDFSKSARAYQADLNAGLISNTTPGEIKSSYAYEMLEMFANLYNHVDDNWNNKVDFSRWNPFLYEFDLWNQIRENMTLESMVSAKERDVNFGSVTEAEWTMLRNAASAIGSAYWGFDTTMDDEFQRMIRVLWKKAYGDESFNLDKWTDFRKEYEKKAAWANPEKLIKSTASEGLGAWQNDSGAFTEPTDGNYVNAYGIIG